MTIKAIILSDTIGAGAGSFKKGFKTIIGKGKILKKFSRKEEESLGEEIVNYIKSLQRGNRFKPLDKDTVYFSTCEIPGYAKKDGTIAPPERVLYIEIPNSIRGSYCSAYCQKTPVISYDGTQCNEQLTLDGVKAAIKKLFLIRKQNMAIRRYAQNPTEANKQAALKLFPPEAKNEIEFILRSVDSDWIG